jgi:HlyD family secretion protein
MRGMNSRVTGLLAWLALGSLLAGCSEPAEEITAPYRQLPVTTRDIVVSASAAGVIEPVVTVEVKSKASGEIIEVMVEEGDEVATGDLLVRVDPRIPRNAVVQAEADSVVASAELANAKSRFRRAEALFAKQSIAEQEFDDARLAQASAYAKLVRTKSALEDAVIAYEDTEVRAPSAGIILGRDVEVGSVITSASKDISGGSVLLRMANLDSVQVRALVDETDIGKVRSEMAVTIVVDAYPNRKFKGRVLRIGAEALVEQNVTMFPVLVRIANEGRMLRPGMNAEVEVHVGSVQDAMTIPNAALRTPRELQAVAKYLGLTEEQVIEQLGRSNSSAGMGDTATQTGGEGQSPNRAEMQQRRQQAGGGRPPGGGRPGGDGGGAQSGRPGAGRPGGKSADDDFLFGGRYAVYVVRDAEIQAVSIKTGLTDFSNVAVLEGLMETDSVLILPTAGLMASQERWQNWARQRAGGPLAKGN